MDDREHVHDHDADREKETVVVQREKGSVGGIIVAIAVLIAVLGILKYFGMLPF